MMIKKQTQIIFFLSLFCMAACKDRVRQEHSEDTLYGDTAMVTNMDTADAEDTRTDFFVDSALSIRLLTTGVFHNDEVEANVDRLSWFGLFRDKGTFYLQPAKITIGRVYDPVLDENESEKTGWGVSTDHKDSCLVLIEALPYLDDRKVRTVALPREYMYPGDSVFFHYEGIDYKIWASGVKRKEHESESFTIEQYKLYFAATIEGQQRTSMLIAHAGFDDQMVRILFAGDIDGDGVLDLIIDTSNHYNVSNPTLYLSRPAGKNEVVKPVGNHLTVGC